MGFVIRHTPVGVLMSAAVQAGQAQGRQVRRSQDLQIANMALTAQARSAQLSARAREQAFSMRQAAAAQIAKQQPTTSDRAASTRQLNQAVGAAEKAGIYRPEQIKQMKIFANLGDAEAVRGLLGTLPKESARRQEISAQLTGLSRLAKGDDDALVAQITQIEEALAPRYDKQALEYFAANPEFASQFVDEESQQLLAQREQLQQQRESRALQVDQMQRSLQLGLSIPEQLAFTQRAETAEDAVQERQTRRLERQQKAAREFTAAEELGLDIIRDDEAARRKALVREINRLTAQLDPQTEDEAEDPEELAERTTPIQAQIKELTAQRNSSYDSERDKIKAFFDPDAIRNLVSALPLDDIFFRNKKPEKKLILLIF